MATRIQGLRELNRKMKAIPPAAKAAARKAVVQGAEEIAAIQRTHAPVDEGDLKDSIHVTLPGQTTPPYSQPGGSRTAGPEEALVTAGNTKVRTAHLVEFGTKAHIAGGIFEGALIPDIPAQPFFWPGYRAVRKRVRSRVTREINKAIKAAATGGGT